MSYAEFAIFAFCMLASASLGASLKKRYRCPEKAFDRLQGAVLVSQSDESMYDFQEILLSRLKSYGMKVVGISQDILLGLLKTGEFPQELSELMIDVVMVGNVTSVPHISEKTTRDRWYSKARTAICLEFTHTLTMRIYNSSGEPMKNYLGGINSEDYLTAFCWFAEDLAGFLYQELRK